MKVSATAAVDIATEMLCLCSREEVDADWSEAVT